MKKSFFKGFLCCLALLIISTLSYADEIAIPKTLNIQGRYTKSYGDPVANKDIKIYFEIKKGSSWSEVGGSPFSAKTDSEGLYNTNISVDISSDTTRFRVGIDSKSSDDGYPFSSVPFSFYASEANSAFSLSTSGKKLVDENFYGYIGDNAHTYTIKVDSATGASKISTSGNNGYVWGMRNTGTETKPVLIQDWISPSSTIPNASSTTFGLVKLYNSTADSHEDGSVTQKAIRSALLSKQAKITDTNKLSASLVDGLATVATTGNYTDLENRPTIPAAQIQSDWTQDNTDSLDYIKNKPTIPAAQVNSDWNATEGLAKILNKPTIPTYTGGAGITVSGTTISAKVDGTNIVLNSSGEISLGEGADLAEVYKSKESLQPGDVVSIDTSRDDAIVKTKVAEDTLVAGVISTEPGLLLNSAEKGYKLALVGKVPTKVCNEGGEIKRGDLLVSASIAGYAKKAGDNPKPGTVIGKALENFSSKKGTILVLVNLQ